MFQSGRYYRVTRAAQELASSILPTNAYEKTHARKYEAEDGGMLYSLDFITKIFVEISHVTPFLTLQWFYVLKLMKYFHHPLWQGKKIFSIHVSFSRKSVKIVNTPKKCYYILCFDIL